MLGKPENGWTQVKIGDFIDRASYLTDIPKECLDACIYSLENGVPLTLWFDAEGWDYIVVSSNFDTFIIVRKDELPEYKHFDISRNSIIEEIYADIKNNIEDWSNFSYAEEDYLEDKKYIVENLNKLSTLLGKKLI